MYSNESLASDLEKTLIGGFNVSKIANAAFSIYQEHCLELTEPMYAAVFVLVAMDEAPEFELMEHEFIDLIEELRTRPIQSRSCMAGVTAHLHRQEGLE